MKRYIYEALKSLRGQTAFSMPGHKSKDIYDFDFRDDITEVVGADNLMEPEECILKSEEEIAKVYGVKRSYFITEGSTMALKIAIALLTKSKDTILVQRNSHKSIYNSAVQFDLNLEYISPKFDVEKQLLLGIETEELDKKLNENKSIKVVVLTSPNYYGMILNLKELSEVVHKHGCKLIVDEAHGGHLIFSRQSELSAVRYADVVVHSTHKTLPSLTGSSMLHINCEIEHGRVLKMMSLLMSSSPSYLSMLSSEFGIAYLENTGGFEKIEREVYNFKEHLREVVEFLEIKDNSIADMDILKLAFRTRGNSGLNVVNELALRYNIRLEMGDLYYALCILSVVDETEDFKNLENALKEISVGEYDYIDRDYKEITPKIVLSPKKAFESESEMVDIEEAVGRVSSSMVMLYPPGVPIVAYGEEFTEEVVRELKRYPKLSGVVENKVEVVK